LQGEIAAMRQFDVSAGINALDINLSAEFSRADEFCNLLIYYESLTTF